jgi:hypothetical protein
MVSLTPQLLYPHGNGPCYPLDRRLAWHQSRSGCGGEENHSQPLPGFEPLIIQTVAQRSTTELSRLIMFIEVKVKINTYLNIIL